MKGIYTTLLIFLAVIPGFSQSHDKHEHEPVKHFRISASLGHTWLPKDTRVGKDVAVLPSFGLDIEYWFNHKWGIGLHNDLELLNFQVREAGDIIIDRDYPVLVTLDVMFRAYKGLTVYFGPGMEFEVNEDFVVTRFGIEYEIDIDHGWDVHPVIFYDARHEAYNTLSVGIGFGKRF